MLDDRLGYATHLDQGWSTRLLPMIANSGAGWIRDDLSWGSMEQAQGTYTMPPEKQAWINAVQAAGLKLVLCLNYPPKCYDYCYDTQAAASFCAWFAQLQGSKVAAIEITNEPNNSYRSLEGADWEAKLVTLTNAIYTAVKAVSPTTEVIGLGAQGQQIFNMLSLGVQADGIVAHPYSDAAIAERTYEPPFCDYASWIQALQTKTTLPLWETEWGFMTFKYGEYYQACNLSRRILESLGLGVAHTFIYDFMDSSGETFGTVCGSLNPKQAYFAVQRTISTLAGVQASGETIGLASTDSLFNAATIKAYAFQGPTKTVTAVWISGCLPDYHDIPISTKVTFSLSCPCKRGAIVDPVTGTTASITAYPRTWTASSCTVTIPISSRPTLIVMD